jgi:site-specific DNA-methyltransferase (adenine-specific)
MLKARLSKLWNLHLRMNGIQLIHGDCLEEMEWIPDKSIQLLVTDLPFGSTGKRSGCTWDIPIDLDKMWAELKRIGVENCAYIFNCKQPFTTDLINSNRKWFSYELIWEKERPTNIFTMKDQPGQVHENIAIFGNKRLTYNPIMEPAMQPNNNTNNQSQQGDMNVVVSAHYTPTARIGENYENYDSKMRYPRSVKKIPRGTKGNKKLHPTQKPVTLYEDLIRTYSNEGDTVLDICAGSFSTAVAASNSNRNYIGIEKDDNFFDVGRRRLKELGIPYRIA